MSVPLLPLLALLAAGVRPAGDKPAPVHVDAEEVHYLFPKRQVIFTGAPVTLTRDDAVLTCKRLVANNDERGQIVTATCTGDVRFTRRERVVTCATATFDNAGSRVTCEGAPVVLREPGTEAEGSRLVYELATDQVSLKDAKVKMSGEALDAQQKQMDARRRSRGAAPAVPEAKR